MSEAATLADAVRALAAAPRHVLLDLMLPDGCGTDVLRRLGAEGRASAVCVITGCGPALLEQARGMGAGCVLTKPVNVEALLAWLGAAAPADEPAAS